MAQPPAIRIRPGRNALEVAEDLADQFFALAKAGRHNLHRRLVEAAHDTVEGQHARDRIVQPVACKAGCAFCCHQMVSATTPEILLIAESIMAEKPVRRGRRRMAIRKADAETRGRDMMQRWALRHPCPMLEADGLCGIYARRPITCRGYASLDVAPCRTAFETSESSTQRDIPVSAPMRTTGVMVNYALEQALQKAGLPRGQYELNQGLTIALDMGPRTAIKRYLSGEDVLAAARVPEAPVARAKGAV